MKLGHCKLIEEVMIGEDKLIHFSGVSMGTSLSSYHGYSLSFITAVVCFVCS